MSRWVRIQADVFEHPVFATEPFSEREAWLWLIAKAAWKETKHRIKGALVTVPTGSLFVTLRELQAVWRWRSDTRVRAFLRRLENERMISLDSNAGKTHVTICNYEEYQNPERAGNAEKTHGERTENALKTPIHQDTNSSSLRSEEPRERVSGEFDEFWSLYPNKVGKRDAEKAFVKALKRASLTAILTGLRRYVAKTDDRPWCNPATWLNQDRWADEPAAPPPRRATDPPRERTVSDVLGDIAAGKWPLQDHNHEPDFLTIDASLSSRN